MPEPKREPMRESISEQAPESMLRLTGLNAFYGDFQALYGVDLQINKGEVIAIIGANGAGKSTLLRSIAGLIKNDASAITFNGQPIGEHRADQVAHAGIALVPEGRQLFASLSVEENLLVGGKVGRSGPWTLDAVYAMFPILLERRAQPSTSLSGGQQQMLAIGRALMANPELILFDEISLGLAPVIIGDIYKALPGIVGDGITAVIVEQDIARAVSVSSRVYCLREGRVVLQGSASEITRDDITQAYFGKVA